MRVYLVAMLFTLVSGQGVTADTLSTKGRMGVFESQGRVLDRREGLRRNRSLDLAPKEFSAPTMWDDLSPAPSLGPIYRGPFLDLARQAARRHGVPEYLFVRLVQRESAWRADAVSHKGAIGLAQLMPQTARVLGVDPRDPRQNLEGGARYLAQQYRSFGSWRLALAAYNAGPGAVEKYGGVPPYAETQSYVRVILGG